MYSFICYRTFVVIYRRLEATNSMRDIRDLTGCGKPCHYNQYNLVDKLQKYSASYDNWSCAISIWVISPDTSVETEELIYPWTSLVAEFGGALGLFLGVSFMTIWDWGLVVGERIEVLKRIVKYWARI